LGGVRPFDDLLEDAPRADEAGEAWGGAEETRFGRHARRLWERLLAGEELRDR
jgi:hypothetical protein